MQWTNSSLTESLNLFIFDNERKAKKIIKKSEKDRCRIQMHPSVWQCAAAVFGIRWKNTIFLFIKKQTVVFFFFLSLFYLFYFWGQTGVTAVCCADCRVFVGIDLHPSCPNDLQTTVLE